MVKVILSDAKSAGSQNLTIGLVQNIYRPMICKDFDLENPFNMYLKVFSIHTK
ncbi:unnamed protein product (macronuclear) [Paramecium tetraurelia]|uniref:Uncharacterized protein n=1 Tax=Paramecium tetraurelia TaxID=5888 RepID=A0BTP8_PARTE|nr:uncharacterized protein GSPATT00032147001 [Paramecium tetraurelia]CAK61915.1 unnamed protein product [Paramecium tetraurelia]|eukprot:XP_001429313.1 hypothetical protein (macronuclear) [Paramecium tetraurelia strain d4-2]